jgi:hypothetical protein
VKAQSSLRFRMPVEFGPSPGPRQRPDGGRYEFGDAPRTTATVRFRSEASALEKLLPAGCELDGPPVLTVQHAVLEQLEWLAGRSYSVLRVMFPVRFRGTRDDVRGPFLCVLWENRADPIITGREELGYPKLYCELPDKRVLRDETCYTAEWDGHQFLRMKLRGLKPSTAPETAMPQADGVLTHRYLPPLESSDYPTIDELVLSPTESAYARYESFAVGEGEVEFVRSTWEELPTMFHIINTLADLPQVGPGTASVARTRGSQDLRVQRVLR